MPQAVSWLPESDVIDAPKRTGERAHCRSSRLVALTAIKDCSVTIGLKRGVIRH